MRPFLPAILRLIIGTSVAQTACAQVYTIQFDSDQVGSLIVANNVEATLSIDGADPTPLGETISCAIATPGPGGWILAGRFGPFAQCNSGVVYATSGIEGWQGLGELTPLYGCYDVDQHGTVTLRLTTSELGCASPGVYVAGDYNGDGRRSVGDLFAAVGAYCGGSLSLGGLYDFLGVYFW